MFQLKKKRGRILSNQVESESSKWNLLLPYASGRICGNEEDDIAQVIGKISRL